MPLRRTILCAAVVLASLPARALAARAPWATVNVCDSSTSPDTVGVRGAMTGVAGASLFMRFQLQYQRDDGSWRLLASADSGLISVGRARAGVTRQAGHSFGLVPPPGRAYTVRGLVSFEWRARDGAVLRRARRITTGGHRSTAGANPPGFSAAECTIAA